jgi:aspartate aminotransferase-like enzyme
VPSGKSGRALAVVMKSKGWVIGSGYGPLKQSTIRIGHMGDHSPARLEELLHTLESVAV